MKANTFDIYPFPAILFREYVFPNSSFKDCHTAPDFTAIEAIQNRHAMLWHSYKPTETRRRLEIPSRLLSQNPSGHRCPH